MFFVFCLGWALIQVYPIIWMYYSSLKENREILRNVMALPSSPQFHNWADVWWGRWGDIRIGRYMMNSFIVTGFSLAMVLLFAYPAGYALARYSSRLNKVVIILLFGTMCIPMHTIIVPLYVMLSRLGLTGTYAGVIFPYVALNLPFAIILTRAYFVAYPREIEDAARIDGCSEVGLFLRVIIPGSKIIFTTLIVVVFPSVWNEYMLANIILTSNTLKTLPVGVGLFKGSFLAAWDYTFAAIAIATTPAIIIYFLFQRHIVKGMSLGAVKG